MVPSSPARRLLGTLLVPCATRGGGILGPSTAGAATAQHIMACLVDVAQAQTVRCLSTPADQQDSEVCTSLAEASRRGAGVSRLHLNRSDDLMCTNMMCEKVGEACICRLSRVLERANGVQTLKLSGNNLEALPASLWQCQQLVELDLSNNRLEGISGVEQLEGLEVLDISGNPIKPPISEKLVASLRRLRELRVDEETAKYLPGSLHGSNDAGAQPRLVVVAAR